MLSFKITNKEKNKIYNLNQLLLSKNNLRFTLISKNNDGDYLVNFLKEDTVVNNQQEIFEKLFYNEGDLSDLKRLFNNINIHGFDNSGENIFIIHTHDDNYIVAEGNRRVMCLKILFDYFKIPSVNSCVEKNSFYPDENYEKINDLEDTNLNFKKRLEKNYKDIVEIIEQIKSKEMNWIVHCEVIDSNNPEYLWKIIYDKHLNGERPGMRKWSRGKYFADLLNVFSEGLSDDEISKKFMKNINREKDYIVRDYKEAEFIYFCFYYGKKFDVFEDGRKKIWNKRFNDNDILDGILKSNRISSLERLHSINKIRKIFCEEILNITDNNFAIFDNEYFSIHYDDKNFISFSDKKISKEKLLKFIYDNWEKKIITTRPIKKDDLEEFVNNLKSLFDSIDYDKKISLKKLNEIDAFNISKNIRRKIINVQSLYYDLDEIKRFELANSIIEDSEKVSENMNKKNWISYKNTPLEVFLILSNQLKHNSDHSVKFLNAIFSTIRSFFEQFLIWLYFLNFDENQEELKSNHVENMAKNRIDYMLNSKGKEENETRGIRIDLIKDKSKLTDLISKAIVNGVKNKQYKFIVKTIEKIIDSKVWREIINENIHSSHRVYLKSTYIKNLLRYKEFLKLVLVLIDEVDFKIFEDLNNRLIHYIVNNKPGIKKEEPKKS